MQRSNSSRQQAGDQKESGQELRVRLDHMLRDLTPTQRIDLAMVLMAEGVAELRQADPSSRNMDYVPGVLPLLQISRMYAIGQRRIYALVHSGEIPSIRLGNRFLLRPETVEAWLISQESSAGDAARPD